MIFAYSIIFKVFNKSFLSEIDSKKDKKICLILDFGIVRPRPSVRAPRIKARLQSSLEQRKREREREGERVRICVCEIER